MSMRLPSPNKQLQQTVTRRRERGACAPLHYAHAPRITRHRAPLNCGVRPMSQVLEASLLVLLAPALSAAEAYDSASECSLDAFAAYGQTWSGLPVIPKVISVRSGIDGTLCGLLVDAKRETIEEWYQQHLIKDGWRLAHRHEPAEGVESTLLIFLRGEQTFKLSLTPGAGGTIVLMFKPEPNKAMEPTR